MVSVLFLHTVLNTIGIVAMSIIAHEIGTWKMRLLNLLAIALIAALTKWLWVTYAFH